MYCSQGPQGVACEALKVVGVIIVKEISSKPLLFLRDNTCHAEEALVRELDVYNIYDPTSGCRGVCRYAKLQLGN